MERQRCRGLCGGGKRRHGLDRLCYGLCDGLTGLLVDAEATGALPVIGAEAPVLSTARTVCVNHLALVAIDVCS